MVTRLVVPMALGCNANLVGAGGRMEMTGMTERRRDREDWEMETGKNEMA